MAFFYLSLSWEPCLSKIMKNDQKRPKKDQKWPKKFKKVQKYENVGRHNDCVLDERVKSSKELPRLVVKLVTSSIREVGRSRIQDNLISGETKSCRTNKSRRNMCSLPLCMYVYNCHATKITCSWSHTVSYTPHNSENSQQSNKWSPAHKTPAL